MNLVFLSLFIAPAVIVVTGFTSHHLSGKFGGKSSASFATSIEYKGLSDIKSEILSLCRTSNRGMDKKNEKDILKLAEFTENNFPIFEVSALLLGKWELLWANDDLTRSSPFFWAFKKAFGDLYIPFDVVGTEFVPNTIFRITDAIPSPLKEIDPCFQTFDSDSLLSEVEIKALKRAKSIMTTSSSWRLDDNDPASIEISVKKTQVLDSTIARFIPFFDDRRVSFPSGRALDIVKSGSSKVTMKLIYLDEDLRISKNVRDNKYFVYTKVNTGDKIDEN